MEKELGISGKKQIEEYGVAKFNEACRSIVLRYTREWRKVITRLGRWVDFDHDYKTMDPDYMETIWWVLASSGKRASSTRASTSSRTVPAAPRSCPTTS